MQEDNMNREQRMHGEINITHDCSQRVPVKKNAGYLHGRGYAY
jgi:hypothetical protein